MRLHPTQSTCPQLPWYGPIRGFAGHVLEQVQEIAPVVEPRGCEERLPRCMNDPACKDGDEEQAEKEKAHGHGDRWLAARRRILELRKISFA